MRPIAGRDDGSIEVLDGVRPAARSGGRLRQLTAADVVPLPEGTTLMLLPGRAATVLRRDGDALELGDNLLPLAAVLPVGHLRTLVPATRPLPGSARLPLYGYAAVAEHRGRLVTAAMPTDQFGWWTPSLFGGSDVSEGVADARMAMPDNRLVEHLAVCALENRCYTAQNTFLRRYEGALPASPACNADCLGCISLQSDGRAPAPQPRMRFAPTWRELAELAEFHLTGDNAAMVSFGQGCEGESLTRGEPLVRATRAIRRRFPDATIHVNTNGSKPDVLRRMIDAGCTSVRVSAISFTDKVFRAYYRPVGYSLEDVVDCGRVMRDAGGQVCVNLLTFPGLTDAGGELERTAEACRDMGAHQIQWRSLNVDHDWLLAVLSRRGAMPNDSIGMEPAYRWLHEELPGVAHGNFTRPWPHRTAASARSEIEAAEPVVSSTSL